MIVLVMITAQQLAPPRLDSKLITARWSNALHPILAAIAIIQKTNNYESQYSSSGRSGWW